MRTRARMRGPAAVLLVSLLVTAPLAAREARANAESAGTRAASFLSDFASPSIQAMGGAALGLASDVQGASVNAAGIANLASGQLVFAHTSFADATSQEWAAFAGRVGRSRTRWGATGLFRNEGAIDGRDASGNPIGEVSAQSVALGVQLARPFGSHVLVGGAARYVGQSLGSVNGIGLAFDAGAQVRLGKLGIGVAGQNFGGGMRWEGQQWRMPASFGAGLAYTIPSSGLALALDWVAPADYHRSLRAGAEWRWRDRFALRGGWRHELASGPTDRLSGPTFGMGVGAGLGWVDYSFVSGADGTTTHRVAFSLRSGRAGGPPAVNAKPAIGPQPDPGAPKR